MHNQVTNRSSNVIYWDEKIFADIYFAYEQLLTFRNKYSHFFSTNTLQQLNEASTKLIGLINSHIEYEKEKKILDTNNSNPPSNDNIENLHNFYLVIANSWTSYKTQFRYLITPHKVYDFLLSIGITNTQRVNIQNGSIKWISTSIILLLLGLISYKAFAFWQNQNNPLRTIPEFWPRPYDEPFSPTKTIHTAYDEAREFGGIADHVIDSQIIPKLPRAKSEPMMNSAFRKTDYIGTLPRTNSEYFDRKIVSEYDAVEQTKSKLKIVGDCSVTELDDIWVGTQYIRDGYQENRYTQKKGLHSIAIDEEFTFLLTTFTLGAVMLTISNNDGINLVAEKLKFFHWKLLHEMITAIAPINVNFKLALLGKIIADTSSLVAQTLIKKLNAIYYFFADVMQDFIAPSPNPKIFTEDDTFDRMAMVREILRVNEQSDETQTIITTLFEQFPHMLRDIQDERLVSDLMRLLNKTVNIIDDGIWFDMINLQNEFLTSIVQYHISIYGMNDTTKSIKVLPKFYIFKIRNEYEKKLNVLLETHNSQQADLIKKYFDEFMKQCLIQDSTEYTPSHLGDMITNDFIAQMEMQMQTLYRKEHRGETISRLSPHKQFILKKMSTWEILSSDQHILQKVIEEYMQDTLLNYEKVMKEYCEEHQTSILPFQIIFQVIKGNLFKITSHKCTRKDKEGKEQEYIVFATNWLKPSNNKNQIRFLTECLQEMNKLSKASSSKASSSKAHIEFRAESLKPTLHKICTKWIESEKFHINVNHQSKTGSRNAVEKGMTNRFATLKAKLSIGSKWIKSVIRGGKSVDIDVTRYVKHYEDKFEENLRIMEHIDSSLYKEVQTTFEIIRDNTIRDHRWIVDHISALNKSFST